MEYRSVGNRCAVRIESLQLYLPIVDIIEILNKKGFQVIDVDIIALACQCIKNSVYRRGVRIHEAPNIVDCSSLMKWLYGQVGIWLPRRSIQQREYAEHIGLSEISCGDVIFVTGWINYYLDNHEDGVGHVGIATGDGTVIYAAGKDVGVIESKLEHFITKGSLRGIRRYIKKEDWVITLEIPPNRDVELENDIRWIVLQSLPQS